MPGWSAILSEVAGHEFSLWCSPTRPHPPQSPEGTGDVVVSSLFDASRNVDQLRASFYPLSEAVAEAVERAESTATTITADVLAARSYPGPTHLPFPPCSTREGTRIFDDSEPDKEWEPNDGSARDIWKRLDLLMSFAERQTSEAHHDEPRSLLWALNYLRELERSVQTELDYAISSH